MRVGFIVGPRPCIEGFSQGPPVFLPTSTNTNIQIPFGLGNSRQEKPPSGMSTARFPFIYLIPISIPNIFNGFCLLYLLRKKGRSSLITCHSIRMF